MSSSRAATRAFQFGKLVGALGTAAALRTAADAEAIRQRRSQAAVDIQGKASLLAKARHGSAAARRHGLAVKERLLAHRQLHQSRRLAPEVVVTQLRGALSTRRPGGDRLKIDAKAWADVQIGDLNGFVEDSLGRGTNALATKLQ